MKKAGKWSRISRKKKILLLAVVIVGTGVAAWGIYFLEGIQGGHTAAREVPIQEIQAEVGTVSDTIVGTGNLQYQEGSSVTIPSGIVVDEVNVEENDYVSQGDVLAVINQVSVRRAMEDIQEELDDLDEEIEDSKEEEDSQSVTSKTEGTVKKIYVQQGQEVADCMAEHGALLLLSVGSADEEGTEDELAVTATVGTMEEIYVSEGDDVYEGTTLFQITNDGQSLEYQELMAKRQELVQSLQKLTALSKSGVITAEADGIIKSVNISAQGSATGTESGQESQAAATTAKTTEISQNAATVVGNAEISQNAATVAGNAEVLQNAATVVGNVEVSQNAATVVGSAEILKNAVTMVGSAQDSGNMDGTGAGKNLVLEVTESGASNQELLVIESPKTGNVPQTVLRTEDGSYQGQVSWKPECKKFAAETSYQAFVTLTAGEGYLFCDKSIAQAKAGVLSGVTVAGDGKELSFCLTYPFTAAEKTNSQKEDEGEKGQTDGNGNNKQEGTEGENKKEDSNGKTEGNESTEGTAGGDIDNGTGGTTGGDIGNGTGGTAGGTIGNGTGETAGGNQNAAAVGNASENGSQSVNLASTSASSQSSSQESGQNSSTEGTDLGNEVTAFTISSSETMVLAVNVDELDINSVSEGQQAEITLDALEDETFTGTVTKVGGSASSSNSGVAKYTVEVESPGDERMKEGMNASAIITIEKRENVVTIPVNALQERGTKVFVYTQADSEGNLAGEQEVTTGLSDGSTVEITEGLSEGDKVYYQRLGNISGQKESQGFGGMEGGPKGDMGDMPNGGMPDGGGMPGGGDMPGGGRPSNQ